MVLGSWFYLARERIVPNPSDSYATPYIVNPEYGNLGPKVFFIWGSTCAGCFIFTYFCVPETKGLSLEQIDILYQNTTPVKSVAYRKQLIAHNVHAADEEAVAKVTDETHEKGTISVEEKA